MAPLPRRRSRRAAAGMHARGRKAKPRAPSRRSSLGRTTGCRQGRRRAAFDHRAQRRVTTMSEHGLPAMSIVIVTDAFDTIRKTVAHLRAQTVRGRPRAAAPPPVPLAESHCSPDPAWAEALLDAHRGPWAAVGPALYNANPGTSVSWVNLLMDYGPWLGPPDGGGVGDLPRPN